MTFLRGIFIGIMCASGVFITYSTAQADTDTREPECKYEGKQIPQGLTCDPKGQGIVKPKIDTPLLPPHKPKSLYTPTCEPMAKTSKQVISCFIKECQPGFALTDYNRDKLKKGKKDFLKMGSDCKPTKCGPSKFWQQKSIVDYLLKSDLKKNIYKPYYTKPADPSVARWVSGCAKVKCTPGTIDDNATAYYLTQYDPEIWPQKNKLEDCRIFDCKPGYTVNTARTKCEPNEQPNNNTITYDLQGGRWPEDPGLTTYDPTQDTDIGTKPEKENYIFMGWCIDSPTCASPVNAIPSGKSGQIKLYARWKQETIAQLSNAEKVNELENIEFPEQTTCSPLDLYNLNAIEGILKENKCIPTKCKNEFGNANNEPENGACLQKNVDAPEKFVITLEQNGGTGCEDALETYTRGEPMSVACLPTKGGFVFDGWYRDAEFKESASKAKEEQIKQQMQENGYGDGDINYKNTIFITANDSGDKTFYAKWIQKEKNTPRTECTEPEKAVHPNAVAFEYTDGVCKPTACKENYNLQGGKCVKSNLQQAQEDYDAAKENEQSLANRTLGSLSMAATGIGGMELAQGLAEQNADKQAEADMTAYISTFNCKVGDKRYKGGETGVELPGANQLTQLYQEYTTLAADLKARKEALGKAPGIESEVILDKANMGLYDNVGHGIENGAYASLYRASKGNENDIQKLQDQQDASKKRVTAGAVVGGVGAVGGIIGNIAINSNGTTRTTSVADGEPANNIEISASNGDDELILAQRSIDDYEEDDYLDDQSFQLQDQSDNTGSTESTPKAQTFGCGVGSNIVASLKGCSSTYATQAELTKCTTCIENAGTYENGRCYIEIIGWACLGKGWTGKGTPNPIPCDAANRYNDCHIIRKYVDAEKPFVCDPVELMPGKKAVLSGCGRHGWTAGDKHPPMNIGGGGKEQDCKLPLVNNTDWRKMYTKGSAIGIVYNGKTTVTANWCMPAANSSPWNNKNHTGNSIHLSPTSLMAGGERKDKWFSLN
ncbi:MAG: InlB B-repeat-containing protein [Alphaproteobacteria bacterium]|nr:InlB B-repeat-containing protein [Alphaproteobacteria bacterium]